MSYKYPTFKVAQEAGELPAGKPDLATTSPTQGTFLGSPDAMKYVGGAAAGLGAGALLAYLLHRDRNRQ